ncbi:MAG: hypothetical protein WBA74_12060 [Cyclobacteriaceae bacterium]
MLQLFILYDLNTRNCYLDSKERMELQRNSFLPENIIIAGELTIHSSDEYQKALKLAHKVRQTYDMLHQLNISW